MFLFKRTFWLVLLALMLTHCMTMSTRTVTLNKAQLQQKLNQKLAKPLTVLKVFHVQFSNAQVALDGTTGRMHALMDAAVQSDLMATPAVGKLGVSGVVRFDPAMNAVVLDQTAIDSFQLDGAQAGWNNLLQSLTKDLGSKWLGQWVLYEVKPEDLTYAGKRYQPADIQVTADGLQVTLKPQ